MSDAIFVLNAGSSSLKFSIYGLADQDLNLVAHGEIEGLGASRTSRRRTSAAERWRMCHSATRREARACGSVRALGALGLRAFRR